MKRFKPYRDIRKQAMVLGLPLALFALQMVSVIASLLFIIFSFSLGAIVGVFIWNMALYIILSKLSKKSGPFHFQSVLPKYISNKKQSPLNYEDD
ncbi:hypothetical protein NDQ75_11660 [Galbibacter mesophilus]|nr:hypothetical protein [Galbibacter mesophilus]MCM5663634.1 hypothetical protein [Galbibacter mesophilus]